MSSGFTKTVENAPVYGMNTVDHPATLNNGECELLVNAFPSNPPKIRRGCKFVFENAYGIAQEVAKYLLNDTVEALLYLAFTNDQYNVVSKINDSGTILTSLKFSGIPYFSMLPAHNSMYLIMDKDPETWNVSEGEFHTDAPNNKVIEFDGHTVRDMCISLSGYVSVFTQETVVSLYYGLTLEKYYGYQFTYVRRTDNAAFANGGFASYVIIPAGVTNNMPVLMTTYLPGAVEGIALPAYHCTKLTGTNNAIRLHRDDCSSHDAAIRQGATHIRVFRSLGQDSEENALGATKYWVMDIPIAGGTGEYVDKTTDAELGGEFNTCFMDKYTVAPKAKFAEFHKGRMWLYGIAGNEGYAMYSEIAGGDGCTDIELATRYPQKYASMFKPTEYYVDCDHNDNLIDTGIARLNNDLYFFKESKIYALFGGDPTLATVECISEHVGCAFPHTITKCEINGVYGECILFMSMKGPYVLKAGGTVIPATQFKIKELWPEQSTELFSGFRDDYTDSFRICSADFYLNTWWLFCRPLNTQYYEASKMFGIYFSPNLVNESSDPMGAMTLEFNDEINVVPKVLVPKSTYEATLLCTARDNNEESFIERPVYCNFLGNKADAGESRYIDDVIRVLALPDEIDSYSYNFKLLSRRMYPESKPEIVSKFISLTAMCHFEDDTEEDNDLILKVVSDVYRNSAQIEYIANQIANQYNTSLSNVRIRNNIQVIGRDGFYGTFFQFYLNKTVPASGLFDWHRVELKTMKTRLDPEFMANFGATSSGAITL